MMYYSTQPTAPYTIENIDDAFVAVPPQQGMYVQASTIGEIISTNGEVTITHHDTELETNMLEDNDTVVLADGAEMHFSVRDDVEAKIIGPATFSLEYRGEQDGINNYVINLIEGDYLEITSPPVIEATTKMLPPVTDHIIIQASDFSIEKIDTRGSLDVVISTTKDGKKQIENKGSELVVKKIIAEKQTFIAVQTNQKVSINGEVELIEEEERIAAVVADVKENRLEVVYELSKDTSSADTGTILASLLGAEDSLTSSKKVIDEDMYDKLNNAIGATFIQKNVTDIETYYIAGNQESFLIAYSNLLSKISRGYDVFAREASVVAADTNSLVQGAELAENLATQISASYYIDPSDIGGLWTVSVALRALATQSFGGVSVEVGENTPVVTTHTVDKELPTSLDSEEKSLIDLLQDATQIAEGANE